MKQHEDILASLSLPEENLQEHSPEENIDANSPLSQELSAPYNIREKIIHASVFTLKYLASSITIFIILLLGTNYKAYYALAYSYMFQAEMERTEQGIMRSVYASHLGGISQNTQKSFHTETFHVLENDVELDHRFMKEKHAISRLTQKAKDEHASLNIEMTPYENRIVIPRIGKNIPLIDIVNTHVSGSDELEDIFMDELEKGVIRYPGSAKPGQGGNSFIFGHSSNFPWMQGDYNDVFARLNNVIHGDEVIVYYEQKKYVYKIYEKNVIAPGDVSVLQSKNTSHAQISLMTCWPIGTTLNRLILTGDLISVKDV